MRLPLRLTWCALLLLPCTIGAQRPEPVGVTPPSACTFDSCSLRIEPRFFLGETIVVGNGRQERPVGFSGRALVDLVAGNDYAQREAQIASRHRIRGGVISAVSTIAWASLTSIWLNRANRTASDGVFIASTAVIAIGGTWSGYHIRKDHQHAARAVWAYNRDLPR
jgi:hypothetical protein